MAAHLCSQALGVARHFNLFVRPALIVLKCPSFDTELRHAIREDNNPFGCNLSPVSGSSSALFPVDSRKSALGAESTWLFRTFATQAAGFASEQDSRDGVAASVNADPEGSKRSGGSSEHPAKVRRAEKQELGVRSELMRCLREWPPDVNLEEKLGKGEISGKVILNRTLRAVLYLLTSGPSAPYKPGLATEESTSHVCTPEDARKALDIFKWRQKQGDHSGKFSDVPLESLLYPVLGALKQAELQDELRSFWAEYREVAQDTESVLASFQHAHLHSGMNQEVLEMFQDARSRGWPLKTRHASFVVRAMQAKGCSRDEVWDFHKKWIEEHGSGLTQIKAFAALLKSGIRISELQSFDVYNHTLFRSRLIVALLTLGQADEARELTRTFLDLEIQQSLHFRVLLSVLRMFVGSGLVAEAQQLADAQFRLGVSLERIFMRAFENTSGDVFPMLETFLSLQAIEGPHKTSKAVLGLLITCIYAKLPRRSEEMYQAYLKGKGLQGWFRADVYSAVIKRLCEYDRPLEAELVLADYCHARRRRRLPLEPLQHYAIHSLGSMYLRAKETRKLVDLVKKLVNHDLNVNDGLIYHWVQTLRSSTPDGPAEADELLAAKAKMVEIQLDHLNDRSAGHYAPDHPSRRRVRETRVRTFER